VTRIRRLGAVALATPLAIGITVVGVTAPAQAESGISSPAETVTSGSSITVSAKVNNVVRAELQVAPPGDGYSTIASGGNLLGPTRLSNTVGIPRNGTYQVRLRGSVTGGVYDAQSFKVRVPPAAPSGLRSSVNESKAVLRWTRGAEPDLTGYQVAAQGAPSRVLSTAALCNESECGTTVTLPKGLTGSVALYVRSLRSDGSGGTVGSKPSASRATVAAPRGSATGATQRTTAAAPTSVGLPGTPPVNPLTPLQSNSPITLPSVTPEDATPGFEYPAPVPEVAMPPAGNAPKAQNVSATSPLQWGKSVAIALALLIMAAFLMTRTRRARLAEASGGGAAVKGRAGRAARKEAAKAAAEGGPAETAGNAMTVAAAGTEAPAEAGAAGRDEAKTSGRRANGGYQGRRRAQ
jgi:hypothetical protein